MSEQKRKEIEEKEALINLKIREHVLSISSIKEGLSTYYTELKDFEERAEKSLESQINVLKLDHSSLISQFEEALKHNYKEQLDKLKEEDDKISELLSARKQLDVEMMLSYTTSINESIQNLSAQAKEKLNG